MMGILDLLLGCAQVVVEHVEEHLNTWAGERFLAC